MDAEQRALEETTLAPLRKRIIGKTCWDYFEAAARGMENKEEWLKFLEEAVIQALIASLCTIDGGSEDPQVNYYLALGRSVAFLNLFPRTAVESEGAFGEKKSDGRNYFFGCSLHMESQPEGHPAGTEILNQDPNLDMNIEVCDQGFIKIQVPGLYSIKRLGDGDGHGKLKAPASEGCSRDETPK